MDFELSQTQQEIARLAADILGVAEPWKELARSGLLALAVPTELGGDGLGVLEVAVLLTEVGRRAVPVPALGTLMTGVLPIARWGDEQLKRELLPAAAAGELILTAAFRVASRTDRGPLRPTTRISGTRVGVPYAAEAGRILVAVGDRVVLVDPESPSVTITRTPSSTGDPEYTVRLDDAPVAATLAGMHQRDLHRLAVAGACSLADGALAGALALTRDHVATRRQFGRALAEFQAVSQQIADIYIASRTLHLATLSACWRLHTGRDPDADLDIAAWWLREEALDAVMNCHHLHGGIGVDISYPLHRLSSLVRDLSRYLGDAGVH